MKHREGAPVPGTTNAVYCAHQRFPQQGGSANNAVEIPCRFWF